MSRPGSAQAGGGPSLVELDDLDVVGFPYTSGDDPPPARWRQPWSGGPVRILTVLGAVLVGFLLTSGLSAGRDVAQQQNARKADLLVLLEARQARNEALSGQLEQLRASVSHAEEAAAQRVPALAAQLAELESHAGLTRLAGPGLRVTFSDGPSTCSQRPEDCRIQDTDLQLAANTLFSLGAEGVAINGERLIATTAIRSAGGSVLVNYTVLTSPYVLEAIGDPRGLGEAFASSQLASDFAIWRDTYGLGFRMETIPGGADGQGLVLPAYSGSGQLRSAQVVGS